MGDVVDFGDGSDQQEPVAPQKRKFNVPILRILLIAGLCLLVLGVVVTVSIVVVRYMLSHGNSQTSVSVGEEYQDVIPAYTYSTDLPELRLSTSDKPAATVVVKVMIGYEEGNKSLQNEITKRRLQIMDFLRNYFSLKKVEELGPTKERKLKEELRSQLNNMMEAKGIRDILFEKLQTIEQ